MSVFNEYFSNVNNYFFSNNKKPAAPHAQNPVNDSVQKISQSLASDSASQGTLWDKELTFIGNMSTQFQARATGKGSSTQVPSETVAKEIAKVETTILLWKNAKQIVENKTSSTDDKKLHDIENDIDSELKALQTYADFLYKIAMKSTFKERKKMAKLVNQMGGNDFKSRSIAKAMELTYKAGALVNKPQEEVDETIKMSFEMNKMKNQFVGGVAKFIMDPKKKLEEGIQLLTKELETN